MQCLLVRLAIRITLLERDGVSYATQNVVNPEIGRLSSPWKRLGAYVLDYLLLLLIVVVYLVPDAVGEYMDVGAISTVSVVLLVVYAGLSPIPVRQRDDHRQKATRNARG